MLKDHSKRALSAQLIATTLTMFVTGAAAVVLLGMVAVSHIDAAAGERQMRFAERGLKDQFEALPVEQRSSAVWDEAVRRVGARDIPWIENNLGIWMQEYFGHDENYVLSPEGDTIYASRDGETVSNRIFEEVAPYVMPLFRELQAVMAEVSTDPEDSTEALADISVADFVDLGERVTMISLVPIIPDGETLPQVPGTESFHVALQYLDEDFLHAVTDQFELSDPVLMRTPPDGAHFGAAPVAARDGTLLTWLVWQRDRPGTTLLSEMALGILVAVLMGTAVLAVLCMRLWRASAQLQQSEAHARYLAFHDGLTGLPNRALFDDRLSQALLLAQRDGPRVALLCLDIDRFKDVNDTLGHPAGDELVRQVGARLVAFVRETDTVARLGGDEYAVVLVGIAEDQLDDFCERLNRELGRPYDLAGDLVHVTASIGAVHGSAVQSGRDEALRKADIALYSAKNNGRGRHCIFVSEMDDLVRRRHEIERDLRTALERDNQLLLVYQPFFDEKGGFFGAEALLRWDHPVHGMLSPEIFISIAEERGLIHPLGRWVLEQACEFAVTAELPKIAVNVSPVQLRDDGFSSVVLEVLALKGLAPRRLELELTENVVLDTSGSAHANLARLRAAGVSIALDDFATGNSSLQYVREHGVDMLKIDRTFVHQLGKSTESDQLVQAILDFARAMGIRVTAEGVETIGQRNALVAMGCTIFQGYLLGRPMDATRMAMLSLGDTSLRQLG